MTTDNQGAIFIADFAGKCIWNKKTGKAYDYPVSKEQDGKEMREGVNFKIKWYNGFDYAESYFELSNTLFGEDISVHQIAIPIEPEKNDKIIFKATRDYLLTPTHKKLLVWKEIGYRENFNPKLSIEQNDKEFFKWIVDNKKRPKFVKIFGYHLEKHSPTEPDTHLRTKDKLVKKGEAGYEWLNYIKQFSKLDELWNQLPNVPNVWLSQQIDIFAGKYPSKPEPDSAMGWLKKEGYPDVMPMTLDNLGIILDRYKPSSKEQEGDAVGFAEWAYDNFERDSDNNIWWKVEPSSKEQEYDKNVTEEDFISYTTKQLYQLYLKNKNL